MIGSTDCRAYKHTSISMWAMLSLVLMFSLPGFPQAKSGVGDFFRNKIGLTGDEIATIRSGKPVVTARSRHHHRRTNRSDRPTVEDR